ncbi:tRNA (adenosine(37)-N6)-dimethylallyltransferase MiaA [Candidatus Falkowbacteria bacterium HGW-Falkowbacteria-2]|uniref:tRNA dimethylallyltransferase n=1 Tax=Candidatus Falkowbacteria bacterium HGW-Falkowbacteria-2 TaxID=2013769 RepID=A0A2N2DYG8_9BACT|nr:MAG: tRNA (adenosine(37)-N6)-dimethylallyltransferase MiaA [Candidatus Falkowbacteria bacterium HGW-Falkowbacteria-2]
MSKKEIKQSNKPLVLVILGPTASGKTSLGVELAKIRQGEIISADSRQVYKGMDIGTGKDLSEYGDNVKYHLIDIVKPSEEFNLAKYQRLADEAIKDVLSRKHLPIIVGGSGLYLQAIVDNYALSEAKPNLERRIELEALGREELFLRLEKLKPDFAGKLNNSEKNNARRLARYIEIFEYEGAAVDEKKESPYDFLVLGLEISDEKMRERIHARIIKRLDNEDMVGEVRRLNDEGVDWKRLISFGLEYKFISYYLLEKLEYDEMIEKLTDASYRFAKRQKTWFKRWEKQGRKIHWIKDVSEAEDLIGKNTY